MTIGLVLIAMLISFSLIFSHKISYHMGRLQGIRELWNELNIELNRVEQKQIAEPIKTIYEDKP